MLVGNKCDKNEREVDFESAKAFAERLGAMFIESSAKSDINVQKIFEDVVIELKQKLGKEAGQSRQLNNPRPLSSTVEMCDIRTKMSCCTSTWY